jgi:hypothetical protein
LASDAAREKELLGYDLDQRLKEKDGETDALRL